VTAVTRITFYGKPGCHLCEDARVALDRLLAGRNLELEVIDVSLDPKLYWAYGERVPVVVVDGEELFEFFVDEDSLRKRLDRVSPS
jgi:glutaredoxin